MRSRLWPWRLRPSPTRSGGPAKLGASPFLSRWEFLAEPSSKPTKKPPGLSGELISFHLVGLSHYAVWLKMLAGVDEADVKRWAEQNDISRSDTVVAELIEENLAVLVPIGTGDEGKSFLAKHRIHLVGVGLGNAIDDDANTLDGSKFLIGSADGTPRLEATPPLYRILLRSNRSASLWDVCAEAADDAGLEVADVARGLVDAIADLLASGTVFVDAV